MSGSGEVAADENTGVANPETNEGFDVPNISDADTEPAMLEEEEMPTYLSLTSSSRPDESRAELEVQLHPEDTSQGAKGTENRAASPYVSDDQGGGSIYVVSSGEESDRVFDDEDYESDEMELEDEEEEDDEEDSRPGYEDEDESDGDIEPEQFERSSDDFVLRYDTSLEKHHKPRSRSLQDLTNSRGNLSRFVGKRRSVDIMGHYNSELVRQDTESRRDPLDEEKKPVKSSRYSDVPSKVKLYIESIKEQSRRSAELKNRENPIHKNFNESRGVNSEISCARINPANKIIKGYAQNVINAMIEQDHLNTPKVTYGGRRLGENATEKEPTIVVTESKKTSEKDTTVQIVDNHTAINNIAVIPKSNGIIDYSAQNHSDNITEPMETCTANGQEQTATIFNLRSLSYEEYANGDQASNNKTDIDEMLRPIVVEKNGLSEIMEEEEMLSITEPSRDTSTLKQENVKITQLAQEETPTSGEISEFAKSTSHKTQPTNRENPDVNMLWAMLNEKSAQFNEKTAQYDGIRDAFQKTLTENISLKRELEELKKTLAQCRAESKPRETKVASVQTDSVTEVEETKISTNESKISTNDTKPPIPKLFSSSIGSALSSIEQWSDSNCSPAISINPPNMDHVLNSDDSLIIPERTPRRQSRAMSKSFITSSRILQTLANITQGRTKTASPLASVARNIDSRLEAEQGQSKRESNSPLVSGNETNAPRARKRKASDMLGFLGYAEPFKMPHTHDVTRKKINSDSDTDGVFKTPRVHTRTENLNEPTPGGSKDDDNAARITDDFEDTEATDVPENVKCFVYQEEADSKERSFLIQAEEPSKSSEVVEKGGLVRECGPYLLGNVEIRMSEANGTINIWGKEISQEPESQESEYVDVEEEVEEEMMEESEPYKNPSLSRRASLDGQKTPRARFINGSNAFVCSTNKKLKSSPQLVKSSIGKYIRPALSNLARVNALANERETGCYAASPILSNRTTGCEQCESQKRRHFHCTSCDHLSNSRHKQHSCCDQELEVNLRECDRAHDRGCVDNDVILELLANILSNHKRCNGALNFHSTKHCCGNQASEETCRHQNSCHRHSPEREGDCYHAKKRCSTCADDLPSCSTRLTPGNANCCDKRSRSHSLASSCDDEEHPLLQNGHYETPETKRRRLSGKKVRGILTDLLRGCGGCRDPSNASFVGKESASLPNLPNPTIRVTPCTPTQPSCSKSSPTCASHSKHPTPRDAGNEKSCSSCSRRGKMATEIESKLELLTVEMERLRSRSDTFRGMLNLLNADTD